MLVALEVNQTNLLFVTTADSAGSNSSIRITTTGFFPDLDETLLGLALGDVAVVRDRYVSRGRRQRTEGLDWHGSELGEIDFIPFFKGDDGLLPMRFTALMLGALATRFSRHI